MAAKTEDEMILKLWGWGWTKRQIAQALNQTRNQVSGKLFRLGAPKREGERHPPLDLIGQRFGRLLVLNRAENASGGQSRWDCRCDCGASKTVRGRDLNNGSTLSCGCLRASPFRERYADEVAA
jgi:hypothetical protein